VASIDAYEKALNSTADCPFINADLHVNYGVALQYKNEYAKALWHFKRALQIEPHFAIALSYSQALEKYLTDFYDAVHKKGLFLVI
jgi:Tfp pilus assembly protein PilF